MPLNKIPKLREPKGPVVQEIRDKFLETEYKENPDDFYLQDIRHIENMDFLLQRFVIMQRKNIDASVKMVAQILRWRKEKKVYELGDTYFPRELALSGAAFVYEKDKYGNRTIYMRASLCRHCAELRQAMKEYLTYLLMKVDDCKDGTTFAVVLDLTKASLSNYDLEILMHFVCLLKDFFPVNLDYVLAVNFPWILSAAWHLIKRLIPSEKRGAVQFINSDKIFDYIDKENCPDFLGGTCERSYNEYYEPGPTALDFILESTDYKISVKRCNEILNLFRDIIPEANCNVLQEQIELFKNGQYIKPKHDLCITNNNNDEEIKDLNQAKS